MKKRLNLATIFLIFGLFSFAQKPLPNHQSNSSLDFNNFLAGVKYVSIFITAEQENYVKTYPISVELLFALRDRLKAMGFEYVALWSTDRDQLKNVTSLCDIVYVFFTWNYENYSYNNIKLTFVTCNHDTFEFIVPQSIYSVNKKFDNILIKMLGDKKPIYNMTNRYVLKGEKTIWSEYSLK